MNHLGAGVGLLVVVGNSHAVELGLRVVATQHTRRVFPCDGRPCFHLGPRQLCPFSAQVAALGHQVEHTTPTLFVARVPVLHGGVFHFGTVVHDNLHDGGMQLVFVAHGSRAPLQVGDIAVVVGNDECALELSGVAGVDAEIAAQLHGTAHPLGNVDEAAIGEHRRVEGSEEVVAVGHHGAQVLSHKIGMLLHRLADAAEDNPLFGEHLLEGGLHRHRVHDGIHCRVSAQGESLFEWYAGLVEGLRQLGVDGGLPSLLSRR